MRKTPRLVLVLLGAATASCAAKTSAEPTRMPPAAEPAVHRPMIAAKCLLPSASAAAGIQPASAAGIPWPAPKVFVEVATVTGDLQAAMLPAGNPTAAPSAPPTGGPGPRAAVDFSSALSDPRLQVAQVGHLLTTDGTPAKLAWDAPADASDCPPTERRDLTLTARGATAGSGPIALDIDLAPAPPLGTPEGAWVVPEHRRTHTTAVVGDQQTIVLGGFDKRPSPSTPSILVVTPYVLRSDADLRALFECKVRRASKAR